MSKVFYNRCVSIVFVSIQFIVDRGLKGMKSFGYKEDYRDMYHGHKNFAIPSERMLYPLTADPLLDNKVDNLQLVRSS